MKITPRAVLASARSPRHGLANSGVFCTVAHSASLLYRTLLLSVLLITGCSLKDNAGDGGTEAPSGSTGELTNVSPNLSPSSFSHYVDMPDGIKIAVQVWLPASVDRQNVATSASVPAIVEFTRYWRWRAVQPAAALPAKITQSIAAGYAYVAVDVRGSGASTGTRGAEFSLAEARDMPQVIDWVSKQSWSSGRVATLGVSYPGNTAEMAALYRHPALVAAVPRFTDFDWYNSIVMPGGLKNWYIAVRWGANVRKLDLNDLSLFGEHSGEISADNPKYLGILPVDGDDGSILAQAIAEHHNNVSLAGELEELIYRDEYPGAESLDDPGSYAVSIHKLREQFESSAVPMMHWGSWFDAGTAAGVLARFAEFEAPYRYVIGAWSHGAGHDTNPYAEPNQAPVPTVDEQYRQIFEFLDPYTKGDKTAAPKRELVYYTVGEDAWKTTTQWPPEGHHLKRLWLSGNASLSAQAPTVKSAADSYQVDFSAGTGQTTRWATQLGGGDVFYPDRSEADSKLLTYTSAPLETALEITGTAVISLKLSSSHDDGNVIAYLEDVAPDGHVRMLTEGGLRARLRKISEDKRDYQTWGPYHSFEQADGKPMTPGEVTQVSFSLLPVSVRVPAGHALRIALAGHDSDTFIRVPQEGDPLWQVRRDVEHASWIDIPVISPLVSDQN